MTDKYEYWLDCIEGLGANTKRNLIEAFGNAEDVFRAKEKMLQYILETKKLSLFLEARKHADLERKYEYIEQQNINMCTCFDTEFPQMLKMIPDVPFALYYKGKLPNPQIPAVAVIGARECSQYGEFVAKELGALLGKQGIQVISGMAKGIDGISQRNALEVGGCSYAVLGCGVDICYPQSNRSLYEELQLKGGVISTYPPGTSPQAKLFPARNRIVSGLADVLVVIEARCRSGTSITVGMALEQGKDVFAVPGRVIDRLSDGCNKMIKDGAYVFLSATDFMMDLQELLPVKMERLKKVEAERIYSYMNYETKSFDCETEKMKDNFSKYIMNILDLYPQPLEQIAYQLREKYQMVMKQEEITAKLMFLCVLGQVKQDSQGWYSKRD